MHVPQRSARDKSSYHPICIINLLSLAGNNEQISKISLDIFCPYIQTLMPSQALVTEIVILGVNSISLSVPHGTKVLHICPVRNAPYGS